MVVAHVTAVLSMAGFNIRKIFSWVIVLQFAAIVFMLCLNASFVRFILKSPPTTISLRSVINPTHTANVTESLPASQAQQLRDRLEAAHAGTVTSLLGPVWSINRLHEETASHKSTVKLPDAGPRSPDITTYQQQHCDNITKYAQKVGTQDTLHQCPCISPYLMGRLKITHRNVSMQTVQEQNPEVQIGGSWQPSWCKSYQHLAVIIPYRDRQEHLHMQLNHLHPLLQRQLLNYTIFLVEQNSPALFNKAALMDIAYNLSRQISDFDCYIFHDVDMQAEDDRYMYMCRHNEPVHMGAYHSKRKYKLLYEDHFGGVVSITNENFQSVNGYSLKFWGWGQEDDNMATRLIDHGFQIRRDKKPFARYQMILHERDDGNKRSRKVSAKMKKVPEDEAASGLSTLLGTYDIIKTEKHSLYTWILVNLTFKI